MRKLLLLVEKQLHERLTKEGEKQHSTKLHETDEGLEYENERLYQKLQSALAANQEEMLQQEMSMSFEAPRLREI